MSRTLPQLTRRNRTAAALVAAALFLPAAALAAGPTFRHEASARCDSKLRAYDGVDVFGMSANQVLGFAKDLRATEPLLRRGFPRWTYTPTAPLRMQLKRSAHLGRVYSSAYREDPSDNSLPQEVAFENSLRDLRRVARGAKLPACSVRLAAR